MNYNDVSDRLSSIKDMAITQFKKNFPTSEQRIRLPAMRRLGRILFQLVINNKLAKEYETIHPKIVELIHEVFDQYIKKIDQGRTIYNRSQIDSIIRMNLFPYIVVVYQDEDLRYKVDQKVFELAKKVENNLTKKSTRLSG